MNDLTCLDDPSSSKTKVDRRGGSRSPLRKTGSKRSGSHFHRSSSYSSRRTGGGGYNSPPHGLTLIEEMFQEEVEARPKRDIDVTTARRNYTAELAKCVQMRTEMLINSDSSESDTSESDSLDSSDEEEEEDDANNDTLDPNFIKSSNQLITPARSASIHNISNQFSNARKDEYDDEEFQSLTPQKILQDLRNTHGNSKDFRAAHALSMRRKLSSYHRNGIPNAMRARGGQGRRGSAFETSRFMKSRRLSSRIGIDGEQLNITGEEIARELSFPPFYYWELRSMRCRAHLPIIF